MNEDMITLEYEGGIKIETRIMGIFDVKGVSYIALEPVDGDEVYLYRYTALGDYFEVADIPDDEFEEVSREYYALTSNCMNC